MKPYWSRRRWAWAIGGFGTAVIAVAIAAVLFAWSGIYSVAASRGHWPITEWFLAFGMRNSVELRSHGITVPPLDDANLVRLGAAHFHGGCAFCHGAPGIPMSPIARHMLPPPPDLANRTGWSDQELFWLVKNGIKYTGMPAWVAPQRDDEVWAVIAFLKRLPSLDVATYRELALGEAKVSPQGGRELATVEHAADAIAACARCHGADRSGPPSHLVPMLHGQPAEFLIRALEEYARGERSSGIMQPLANDLSAGDIQRVARYYARLPQPAATPSSVDATAVARGRQLATQGDGAEIPACQSCHGAAARPDFPRLAGQTTAYLTGQLRLRKSDTSSRTDFGAIMAPIARRLSDRQIEDVAAYFADPSAKSDELGR